MIETSWSRAAAQTATRDRHQQLGCRMGELKTCIRCMEQKPRNEYYAHSKMKDGLLGACKSCVKQSVRENRKRRIDYYTAYESARYLRDPRRRKNSARSFDRWRRTERGKAVIKARRAAQSGRFKARSAVANAVRDGRLLREPCEVCGKEKVDAHHDDYSKPLQVRWLCRAHHAAHHREHGSSPRMEVARTVARSKD